MPGLAKKATNNAIYAAPPYNGRPIFKIKHGLTEMPKSTDRSGSSYGG